MFIENDAIDSNIEEKKLINEGLFKLGRRSLPFLDSSSVLSMYIRADKKDIEN